MAKKGKGKKVRYSTKTIYQKAGKHTTHVNKDGSMTIFKERGP